MTRSSKTNPCPVCGRTKDADCIVDEAEKGYKVRCHTYIDQDPQLAGWVYRGATSDGMWGLFFEKTEKADRGSKKTEYIYTDANLQPVLKVLRIDQGGGNKACPQYSYVDGNWEKGVTTGTRLHIHLYRIFDPINQQAKADGKPILICEGEGKADLLLSMGIAATSAPGGAGKWKNYGHANYAKDLEGFKTIVLCPDRDIKGVAHMDEVESDLVNDHEIKWLYAFPDSPVWANVPEKEGLDIADWVADYRLNGEQVLAAIGPKREIAVHVEQKESKKKDKEKQDKTPKDNAPIKKTLYQEVLEQLFRKEGEYWISVRGDMYRWEGNHYKRVPNEDIESLIYRYCDNYKVWRYTRDEGGYWEYPYATPGYVEKAVKWVKGQSAVNPERCNPAGVNCTNGVLSIEWEEVNERPRPKWNLEPHDPKKHFYLYKPLVQYVLFADMTHVNKLKQVLSDAEWDIFIKTVGASLDMDKVRSVWGRIRALLLFGEGENGKDTLRDVVSNMYGKFGITGCTFGDFLQYDRGRKFPLSKLEFSRVNWSSENTAYVSLDDLQSLKQIISGEEIDIEGKNKDERQERVKCINLFNFNVAPKLLGNLNATQSRYAILRFQKIFKVGANPSRGELEADPRFKYDQNFIRDNVLPGFLNLALDGLYRLMTEGINYEPCRNTMQEIQMSNSHLQRFCYETGLVYDPEGITYVGEIWDRLEDWYKEEGVLEIDANGKRIWHDQPKNFDKNVTASNQVCARFLELFPKAEKGKKDNTGKAPIIGLSFVDPKILQQAKAKPEANCLNDLKQKESEQKQNLKQTNFAPTHTQQGFQPIFNGIPEAKSQNGRCESEIEKKHFSVATIPIGSNGHSVQNGYASGAHQHNEILTTGDVVDSVFGAFASGATAETPSQSAIEANLNHQNFASGDLLINTPQPQAQSVIEANSEADDPLLQVTPFASGDSGNQLTLRRRYEVVKEQAIAAGKWETFRDNCEPDNEEMIELAELWAEGGFQ